MTTSLIISRKHLKAFSPITGHHHQLLAKAVEEDLICCNFGHIGRREFNEVVPISNVDKLDSCGAPQLIRSPNLQFSNRNNPVQETSIRTSVQTGHLRIIQAIRNFNNRDTLQVYFFKDLHSPSCHLGIQIRPRRSCTVRPLSRGQSLRKSFRSSVPVNSSRGFTSFIENFGTHIITSFTIGGRDVVYVKQHQSSPLSETQIKNYVKDIGEQRFSDSEGQPSSGPLECNDKDVTVIFRRGVDDLVQNHAKWVKTVPAAPDVINMTFVPITSLLAGLHGMQHLTRAIDLYLEYKPPIEELQYFLEFQIPRVWAPSRTNVPGHHRKEPVCPSLQFSLMGPKLYVSSEQISVDTNLLLVSGFVLKEANIIGSLSISNTWHPFRRSSNPIGTHTWRLDHPSGKVLKNKTAGGSNQSSGRTSPISVQRQSRTETSIGDLCGVHIVTGAQLGVWDFGAKNVLHLKLLFSKVPGCTIRRSVWDHTPSNNFQTRKSDNASSSTSNEQLEDKGVDSTGLQFGKLVKIVDLTEMSKGPQDMPGHWLVTGVKLGVEKGKIVLRVNYSLLNY